MEVEPQDKLTPQGALCQIFRWDSSPIHDLVDEFFLLETGALEVDARGLHRGVPKQVGQQDKVVVFVEEVQGEEVAEGVGMDEVGVDAVFQGQFLELLRDSARRDRAAFLIDEQESGVFTDPVQELGPEPDGHVDPADPAPFGINVDVSGLHMFDLELNQLADPGAGRGQGPDDEVPAEVVLTAQPVLEIKVVFVADQMVQERGFRYLDSLEFQAGLPDERQILVDPADAQVDGLGFAVFDQVGFVLQEIILVEDFEPAEELLYCIPVCSNRILRIILFSELFLEFV